MSKLRDQVMEFHAMIGQPIAVSPTVPPEERWKLRMRLLTEEFFEFLEACGVDDEVETIRMAVYDMIERADGTPDIVAVADALADIDYIAEGTRLEFGIDGGPIADAVHASNMRKVGGEKRADGKFLKPPSWAPPDIAGELRKQGWTP